MKQTHDPALRALLLHRLAPDEAAALEDRIVLDDDLVDRVELERIDLLDDYAAGRLPRADHAAVEQHLLQTREDQQRLALARALQQRARTRRPARWILPAGAALAACLALVVAMPLLRSPAPPDAPEAVAATGSVPGVAPGPGVAAGAAHTVTLLAEAQRGAASPRLAIPAATGVVRLQLEVPESLDSAAAASTFEVVIRDAGSERFSVTGLRPLTVGVYRIVELDVARSVLGDGARQIILSQRDPGPAREIFTWAVLISSTP